MIHSPEASEGGALTMAVQTILHHHPDHPRTVLISDRGGEHTARLMAPLLATLAPPHILHLFALRDIAFSNSPIEAMNRTFKHYHDIGDPRPKRLTCTA